MANFLQSLHSAASKNRRRRSGVVPHEQSYSDIDKAAESCLPAGVDPRRGLRRRLRLAPRLLLVVAVAGLWGHDVGATTAYILTPKPETLQQLMGNMEPRSVPQPNVVAEPYYLTSPPRAVVVRSR
jgi:hypothetical protein